MAFGGIFFSIIEMHFPILLFTNRVWKCYDKTRCPRLFKILIRDEYEINRRYWT